MNDALDLLKKDWQKGRVEMPQYAEADIYKMLHKSSTSIVKWILIVSVLELVLWIFLSFLLRRPSALKENFDLFDQFHFMTIAELISYGIIVFFIFKFYHNYKKINTSDSVKKLMQNIINTRKTVLNYVKTVIAISVLTTFITSLILMNYDQGIVKMIAEAEKNNSLGVFYLVFVLFIVVYSALIVLIIWVFYKLIYGIFLKKLYRNYEELKQLD